MNRAEPLRDLEGASLVELLAHALTLDDADDPAIGVLLGASREIGLLVSLATHTEKGAVLDAAELVPVLESIGRRLDVGLELLRRGEQPSPGPTPESTATENPGTESTESENPGTTITERP